MLYIEGNSFLDPEISLDLEERDLITVILACITTNVILGRNTYPTPILHPCSLDEGWW